MRLSFILLLLLATTSLFAQRPGRGMKGQGPGKKITISGKVLDEASKSPLEYATISVHSVKDSTLLGGGVTDLAGAFSIECKPGKPYVVIDFIGYESKVISDIKVKGSKGKIQLGDILLGAGGVTMDDVEITAEKSETTFALDKKVFTVGKDLANRGGTAQEILDNVPSVTVDTEGTVSLRGSENVRILIDGRPSGLVGLGSSGSGLRSIPSNLIQQVEVVTNPSSRFEAEGTAGIINIVLKKDTRTGFNGSFEVTVGNPLQYGAGANINYRSGKINWFAAYNFRHREGPGGGSSYQNYYGQDSTLITVVDRDFNRTGDGHNIRLGADYYLTEKETLTAALSYRTGLDDNMNSTTYRDLVVPGRLSPEDRIWPSFDNPYIFRSDDETEDEDKLEYSLNYRKKFENRKHELTGLLSYQSNGETEKSILRNTLYQNGNPISEAIKDQTSANDENEKRTLLKIDYTHPFSKDSKFEIGGQASLREIDNDFLVQEKVGEEFVTLADRSNNFEYDEDVIGVYGTYGNKINKWSYQLGLRSEYSHVKTALLQTNEINDRDYWGLFPSAFLNYALPANQSMQASYSRRIQRPRFWDLNPFFTFSDERNFFSGNPNLDPQYTDSYELQYLKYFESGNIGSSIYYRHTTDARQRIKTVDASTGTSVTRPVNLSTNDDIGLEVLFSYSGIKWLRLDGNANFFRAITEGVYQDQVFDADTYTWNGRLTSRFTFWGGADLQLRLNHRAGRETTQGQRDAVTSLDLGFTRDFLNKNLTLTLSARDLFNSRKRVYETFAEDFYEDGEFQWRARSVSLTASYRINMKKQRQRRGGGGYNGGGEEF